MHINPDQLIREEKTQLPNSFVYRIIQFASRIVSFVNGAKFVYHFNRKELRKKQVLLISDHSSRNEYIYTLGGYPFTKLNIVMGYHNAFIKQFPLLLKMGVIFKKNLQLEIKPLKDIFSVVSKGGSILLFPEGIQSVTGTTMPVLKSSAKLIRKLGITVVHCKSYGAFLSSPDFNRNKVKGHKEFHYDILFTPEELKNLDDDAVFEKLMKKFRFNDSEWNKKENHKYYCREGLAMGLDTILYLCPECNSEGCLEIAENTITCKHCHNSIKLNPYYRFESADANSKVRYETIPEWSAAQKEKIIKEMESEDFTVSYDCRRIELITDRICSNNFKESGYGRFTLTKKGLFYKATEDSEIKELFFDIPKVSNYVRYKGVKGIGFYYEGKFYGFPAVSDKVSEERTRIAENELLRRKVFVWEEAYKALE